LQDLTPSSSCGLIQPILRFLTYAGIHYVGAAAGTTLRGAHPLFSTSLAILFLGESLNLPILLGTISIVVGVALISWQGDKKQASFRWWHLAYPLGAAFLAGVSHPLRRYTLSLANEPLYLAAVIGIVALPWFASATLFPGQKQRPVWDRRAMGPFLIAGTFETLGDPASDRRPERWPRGGRLSNCRHEPVVDRSRRVVVSARCRAINGADDSRSRLRRGRNSRDCNRPLTERRFLKTRNRSRQPRAPPTGIRTAYRHSVRSG